MERRLKERLIGAAVLVMLAVIFIPMILDNSVETDTSISGSNIPERPKSEFSSRVVPLTEPELDLQQVPDEIEVIKQDVTEVLDEQPQPPAEELVQETSSTPQQAQAAAEPVKQAAASVEKEPEPMGVTAWVVQLGSFSSESNASALNKKLRQAGYASFVEPLRQRSGKLVYRVRVGPELLRSDAQVLKKELDVVLKKEGIQGIVVRYP